MGDLVKLPLRPFKQHSFERWTVETKDAASRRLYLMSFKGMGKSIQMMRTGADHKADARCITRMSFQLDIPWRVALQHCPPSLLQPEPSIAQRLPKSGEICNTETTNDLTKGLL